MDDLEREVKHEMIKKLLIEAINNKINRGDFDWIDDLKIREYLKKEHEVKKIQQKENINKIYPNSGKKWTEDEHEQMLELCKKPNTTYESVSKVLKRTPKAIKIRYEQHVSEKEWLAK